MSAKKVFFPFFVSKFMLLFHRNGLVRDRCVTPPFFGSKIILNGLLDRYTSFKLSLDIFWA